MEIQFLGTGSGVPSKHRNVSSLALKLLNELNEIWLFDCGEATQHQILRTNIKPRKISKVFITHLHGDHIFGLPGFLSSRAFQGGASPLTLYGPPGIKSFVQTALTVSKTHLKFPINYVEFCDGDRVLSDDHFQITVKKVKHGIDSFGFRIVERDKKGSLDSQALKEAGVPFGPLYGQLKAGKQVTLEDGRTIDGKDYIGPDIPGRKITIIGDTRPCPNSLDLAQDADVLVHEGTFSHQEKDLAKAYNHSTSVEAARLAKEAQVQDLLLNHISARYLASDLGEYLRQAQEIFAQTHIMHDFSSFSIPAKG